MEKGEKRSIPGTNPNWGQNLPKEMDNSLVNSDGKNYDNGYNFDEKDDGWDDLGVEKPAETETPENAGEAPKTPEEASEGPETAEQ